MNELVPATRSNDFPHDARSARSVDRTATQHFASLIAAFGAEIAPAHDRRSLGLGEQIRREVTHPASVEIHEIAARELQSPKESAPPSNRSAESQVGHKSTSRTQPQSTESSQRSDSARSDTPSAKEEAPTNTRFAELRSQRAQQPSTDSRQHVEQPAHAAAQRTAQSSNRSTTENPMGQRATVAAAGEGKGAAAPNSGGRALVGLEGIRADRTTPHGKPNAVHQRPMLRVEQHEMPTQVARALARVVSSGGGNMTLRLNPQSLGEIRVEISMHRGLATAVFDVETRSARELLMSELDQLRSGLERRGVVVERLEVRDLESGRNNQPETTTGQERRDSTEDDQTRRWRQEWTPPTNSQAFVEANEDEAVQMLAEPVAGGWVPSVQVERRAEGTLRLEALA